jgi:hypothetical protein
MIWNWPKQGSALDAPMLALQGVLLLREKVTRPLERVLTTDATVTTLIAVPVPVDTSVKCTGEVVARRTGGAAGSANDGAGYDVRFVATNSAGTAALIGSATVTVIGESQAAWTVTVDASGGTIRVRVTGAADNTIQWRWAGRTISVKE